MNPTSIQEDVGLIFDPAWGVKVMLEKMLPESRFLFTELKNECWEHTGSKQEKSLLQESK